MKEFLITISIFTGVVWLFIGLIRWITVVDAGNAMEKLVAPIGNKYKTHQ
jgi:hypothetical protein